MTQRKAAKRKGKANLARGDKVGGETVMGFTTEGLVIFEPKIRPKQFTKTQIRRAVRAVKEQRRQQEKEAAQP